MRRFSFKKLVRDKIPDDTARNGGKAMVKILNDAEYLSELNKKLVEEVEELSRDGKVDSSELADVYEILDAIKKVLKITDGQIEQERRAKAEAKGIFEKRLYIEYQEVPETFPFISYYEKNPDKYPEIKE